MHSTCSGGTELVVEVHHSMFVCCLFVCSLCDSTMQFTPAQAVSPGRHMWTTGTHLTSPVTVQAQTC